MTDEAINKQTKAKDMLKKLDEHYQMEQDIRKEINRLFFKLQNIKDEIQVMQTLILFQMKRENIKR